MENSEGIFELLNVIENDYCIGCGACAAVEDSPIVIKENENGQLCAELQTDLLSLELKYNLDSVCPFTNRCENEDFIAKGLYSGLNNRDKKIGYYDKLFAGYVIEGNYRNIGSSGGFGSWLACELLETKMVDEIIHIKGDAENKFAYSVSKNVSEVRSGAKSRYYPIEMSGVLEYMKNSDKVFAVVGIPCFIKSIRLLSNNNPILKDRIKFTIGLVCGHLKSSFYADMIAWRMGFDIDEPFDIDFRVKVENNTANNYGTKVKGKKGLDIESNIRMNNEIYGTNWGYGFFKYNACDYCDDVVAETADITIGDAWLPEYLQDYKGTNIIISRNSTLSTLIEEACEDRRVKLDRLSKNKIIESQAGGFRHRHNGLAYRLYKKDINKEWRPKKRIEASNGDLSINRKMVYNLRMIIRKRSFHYFKLATLKRDIQFFDSKMKKLTKLHDLISKISLAKLVKKIKGLF